MNKFVKLGVVLAVFVVGGVLATSAFAQGPRGTGPGGFGFGGPERSLVAVAAKTLGMQQADLVAALRSGKTIADVAKEKGVALDQIVDAFLAERQTALKSAVEAKRITQAQADSMLAVMKANVTARLSQPFTPRGYGMGYVDEDNDGVCDNCGASQGMMRGPGSGRGWRQGR